jgi:hypothetical protein
MITLIVAFTVFAPTFAAAFGLTSGPQVDPREVVDVVTEGSSMWDSLVSGLGL